MDPKKQTRILPPLGIFAQLDEALRKRLGAAGTFETLPEGTWLSVQGEPHHSMALILDGTVSVTCHAHGDTIRLADLGPGNTVGEMNMIDPQVASASTRVTGGGAKMWRIDREQFDAIERMDPSTGLALIKALARELCQRVRHDSEVRLRRRDEERVKFLDMDY